MLLFLNCVISLNLPFAGRHCEQSRNHYQRHTTAAHADTRTCTHKHVYTHRNTEKQKRYSLWRHYIQINVRILNKHTLQMGSLILNKDITLKEDLSHIVISFTARANTLLLEKQTVNSKLHPNKQLVRKLADRTELWEQMHVHMSLGWSYLEIMKSKWCHCAKSDGCQKESINASAR